MLHDMHTFIHTENKIQLRILVKEYCISAQPKSQQISSMSNKSTSNFLTLPVELVYRVLDNLDEFTILCSMRNVSTRINTIVDSYHRYQVSFFFISNFSLKHFWNITHFYTTHHPRVFFCRSQIFRWNRDDSMTLPHTMCVCQVQFITYDDILPYI